MSPKNPKKPSKGNLFAIDDYPNPKPNPWHLSRRVWCVCPTHTLCWKQNDV